jgi:hypothetical protein
VATHRELVPTGLTEEVLDGFRSGVMAIADQGMHTGVGDIAILTLEIGTGIRLRVDAFGCAAAAFGFAPRAQAWRGSWRGFGAHIASRQLGQSSGVRGRKGRGGLAGVSFVAACAGAETRSSRWRSARPIRTRQMNTSKAKTCCSMRRPNSPANEMYGEEQGYARGEDGQGGKIEDTGSG